MPHSIPDTVRPVCRNSTIISDLRKYIGSNKGIAVTQLALYRRRGYAVINQFAPRHGSKGVSAARSIPKLFSVSWSFSATLFLTIGLPNLLQKSSSVSFAPPVIREKN